MTNAPSLANCNFFELGEQTDELIAAGIDLFHVDIMDGHYVPNLCFPVGFVADLRRRHPDVGIDVHMMVSDPGAYIAPLAAAGASHVSFPSDSTRFVRRTATDIRAAGMKVGVAINPSQPVNVVEPYIDLLDYVVLMTVEPGFAGQRFLSGSLDRLEELAEIRDRKSPECLIQIDGGIDYATGEQCVARGADILVTGIYAVFGQEGGISAAVPRFASAMADAAAKAVAQ